MTMQQLGKNHGGYLGETIDIAAVLRDCVAAARSHHWTVEALPAEPGLDLWAFTRPAAASNTAPAAFRAYLSTGIHGDAPTIIEAVAPFCPIDLSPVIEERTATGGIISPNLDPNSRPQWPEAFWLLQNKTRQSYTLEAPSDFPLPTRVEALVAGVRAALA